MCTIYILYLREIARVANSELQMRVFSRVQPNPKTRCQRCDFHGTRTKVPFPFLKKQTIATRQRLSLNAKNNVP